MLAIEITFLSVSFKLEMLPIVIDSNFDVFHIQPLPFIHSGKIARIMMQSGHLFVSQERKAFIPDSINDFSIEASDNEQLKCAYALIDRNQSDMVKQCSISFQNLDCSIQYIPSGLVVTTLNQIDVMTTHNNIVIDNQKRQSSSFFLDNHPTKVYSVLCDNI